MGKAAVMDDKGVDYSLEWNIGTVKQLVAEEDKRNASIQFTVEGFSAPVSGWVDTKTADYAVAETAKKARAAVAFRVEVHRKRETNQSIPFEQVDKFDRVRRVTAIAPFGTEAAEQLIAAAEAEAGYAPHTAPRGFATVTEQPPVDDAPPHNDADNPHGNNDDLGGYPYLAKLGMVDLAFETLVALKTATVIDSFKSGDIRNLATRLLRAADGTQASVNGGDVDRGAMSHTRARGAVRTALANSPILALYTDAEEWDTWEAAVTRTAKLLMSIAIEIA